MTLADDLAALIAAREAAEASNPGRGDLALEAYFMAAAINVIEAHGAELAALVAENEGYRSLLLSLNVVLDERLAENARLRAALELFPPMEWDSEDQPWIDAVEEARAALRGPSDG
jgi:hypothetical protein